jgi:hypothetical protein
LRSSSYAGVLSANAFIYQDEMVSTTEVRLHIAFLSPRLKPDSKKLPLIGRG